MKYPEHSLGRVLVEGYRMASWKLHCTVFLANATLRKNKTGLICKFFGKGKDKENDSNLLVSGS